MFDDPYCVYPFAARGENIITLENAAHFTVPALLRGEFDLTLKTSGDYAKSVYRTYLLSICEPAEKHFSLTPRRTVLSTLCGWEKQGQVFSSGEAEVNLGTLEIESGDRLELPGFRDIAELLIDGRPAARSGLSPYVFELPAGRHELRLRCWNMMANRMERYAAPSGLTAPPRITAPA